MIASFISSITSPAWLWVWETIEAVSIIVIGVGCWGEGHWAHVEFSDNVEDASFPKLLFEKRRSLKIEFFWRMVVGGLGLELLAFGMAFITSNREIEELKRENAKLYAEIQPRRITKEQSEDLIEILGTTPKVGLIVSVHWESGDSEAAVFGVQIKELLGKCGFEIDKVWSSSLTTVRSSAPPFGLHICFGQWMRLEAEKIPLAFSKVGLTNQPCRDDSLGTNAVNIFVGAKPLPQE